jgi:hypothetical protein
MDRLFEAIGIINDLPVKKKQPFKPPNSGRLKGCFFVMTLKNWNHLLRV